MVSFLKKLVENKTGEYSLSLRIIIKKYEKKFLILFTIVIVSFALLVTTFLVSLKLYQTMKNEVLSIKTTQNSQYINHVLTRQFLLSTVDWSAKRQKIILFMRDQILGEWNRIGRKSAYEKAYMIAERNMIEAEKFPLVDPLFMLALQWKESSFRDSVESIMGAIGLCQIMPATARLLTGFYQMEYSKKSLYDIETNIKLSSKLLDILYQEYHDPEVVLAGYNGGPWQAHYYKTDRKRLAVETADYIPKIMAKWKKYKKTLKVYNIEKNLNQNIQE